VSQKNKRQQDLLISVADIISLLKKNRLKVLLSMILFSGIILLYTMSFPVVYVAEAKFRQNGKSDSGMNNPLEELFGTKSESREGKILSTLKSRSFMTKLIKKVDIQGVIRERGKKQSLLSAIMDNLRVQYAHLRRRDRVRVYKARPLLSISEVRFEEELTRSFEVEFLDDRRYIVKEDREEIGRGTLGAPFSYQGFVFTLTDNLPDPKAGKIFDVTLFAMNAYADKLGEAIDVRPSEEDESVLVLKAGHPDRDYAEKFLRSVLELYHAHLNEENDRYAKLQLAYLEKRKNEMFESQREAMTHHAENLAKDLSQSGLLSFDKELEFLFRNRLKCMEKINQFDLQTEKLNAILAMQDENQNDLFLFEELSPIQGTLSKLAELKMQRDALTFSLAQTRKDSDQASKREMNKQFTDLEEIGESIFEIEEIIRCINEEKPLAPSGKIINNQYLLVREWINKLNAGKHQWEAIEAYDLREQKKREWEKQKNTCLSYLLNLQRLYEMHQKIIQKRLSHHLNEKVEFQGIELDSAHQIHTGLLKQLNELGSTIQENEFTLKQIDDPNFEICTLSTTLKDPISQQIIKKSVDLAVLIRDEEHHSNKEKERTQIALNTQKRFLKAHLYQTAELHRLQIEQLKKKILSLQAVILDLIHERISLYEKQVKDFVVGQINNIEQQRSLTRRFMNDINKTMSSLPEKWISEELMRQNVNMNKAITEELTRMSEKKNISHNLEIIRSSTVDAAYAPIVPKSPRLLIFGIIGAILGGVFSTSYFILNAVIKGVDATAENLALSGGYVSGYLSSELNSDKIDEKDLSTLRRQASFMEKAAQEREKGKTLSLILGSTVDYSRELARLLQKKQQRPLIVHATFDRPGPNAARPGLLSYFEGAAEEPVIYTDRGIDTLFPGGVSRYGVELICSPKFQELKQRLEKRYDWILLVSRASPLSSEAEALIAHSDLVTPSITDEKLYRLNPYLEAKSSFILIRK